MFVVYLKYVIYNFRLYIVQVLVARQVYSNNVYNDVW